MNKIYSFIAMLMLCFVGTANAQKAWDVVEESVSTSDFKAGEDHFYVLREGDNMKMNDQNQEVSGGHSVNGYMANVNGKVKMKEDHGNDCIVNFIPYSENSFGYTTYVLKSVSTGLYLTKDGFTSSTMAQAYSFTVRKGRAVSEDGPENQDGASWEEYSDIVSETRSLHAEENGAWVLCNPESKQYIGFVGDISFSHYIDTNNWYIYSATPREMTVREIMEELYNKNFPSGFGEEFFPVGENPGCISREFYEKFEAVYNRLEAAMGDGSLSDEALLEVIDATKQILAEYEEQIIRLEDAYFVAKNVGGRGFLTVTDDNKKGRGNNAGLSGDAYNEWTPESVESWNLNNAKFIWKAEVAKESGKVYLKNFATGQYLTSNNDFAMVDENGTAFKCERFAGVEFYFTYNGGMLHFSNQKDGRLINYAHPDDAGTRVLLYSVPQIVIDTLSEKVNQKAMNSKLAELVKTARQDMAGLKYINGFVNDGFYNFPNDSGLVNTVLATYGADKGKTGEELFDGDLKTFYHTAWQASNLTDPVEGTRHWVNLDLGKTVNELVVKFTKRQGAVNGHISAYELYTTDDPENGDWSTLVAKSADSIAYTYADTTTHIQKYQLKTPARYIRFAVTSTRGKHTSEYDKMTAGTGPFWHCSEFRLYDAEECLPNPKFDLIPEAVRSALNAVIEKADAELKKGKAQETTYDELETALKNFWDAYPNADELTDALETAQEMIDKAIEGPGLARFDEGAKQGLQTVVDAINKEIADKTLSLDEIAKYQKQLDEAIAIFNSKLHVPESGHVYRIQGVRPNSFEGKDHAQWGSNVIARDADVNSNPEWGYGLDDAHLDYRLNADWYVERDEKGFTFRNLFNGLYLDNPYEGLNEEEIEKMEEEKGQSVNFSVEPKHFTLEAATVADNAFLITFAKGQFMNFDPIGKVVHYYDRNDMHALFTFVNMEETSFETSFRADVAKNQLQVLSYPFDITEVYTIDYLPMEVLGMKDKNIHLAEIDGTIPAGTPFVIKTVADDEGVIEMNLPVSTWEEAVEMKHVYEPIIVKGLVSAPTAKVLPAGFGYIVNNAVITTIPNTRIKAGTGYFNKDIPAYDGPDGDMIVPVEGEISGVGAGVDNVEIVKNVPSDVYTVSGVKVRSNVKASAATKGLPKGIYIVGGKKVVVK